jgi:5-methylcytosine-specific restriction endonuclease McrA
MTRSSLHSGGQRLRAARALVLRRDGPVCWRCGGWIDVRLSGLHPDGLTLGHKVPAGAGGTDHLDNLGPEHRRCNLTGYAVPDPVGDPVAAEVATIARPIGVDDD